LGTCVVFSTAYRVSTSLQSQAVGNHDLLLVVLLEILVVVGIQQVVRRSQVADHRVGHLALRSRAGDLQRNQLGESQILQAVLALQLPPLVRPDQLASLFLPVC